MCPSLILICAQKDVDCYNHANNATGEAGGHKVVNRDTCASIASMQLTINTSENVISKSSDSAKMLDSDRMWRSTIRNAVKGYFGGNYADWRDRQCCVCLSSDEFSQLGISPGVIAPLQLKLDIEIQNRAVYFDGLAPRYAGTGADGQDLAPEICVDSIKTTPYMICVYSRGVASISPASAVLSVQSLAQHTASAILSSNN